MSDSYKTIIKPTTETLYKDRGSKFYANAIPLTDESLVSDYIDDLRKRHNKAGHHCYAWKIGPDDTYYRCNDDGEPNHSAGDPIFGQINSFELSDLLVVVSRVFGGTKLGVSGLINAYRESAKLALQSATITWRTIQCHIDISFDYAQTGQVMRFIDQHQYPIVNQNLTDACVITIAVPVSQQDEVVVELNSMYPIKATTQV